MLNVERLDCENPKYHKGCVWVRANIRYPDTRYLLLKQRLIYEVKRTEIAYRILHHKFGVLTTIKLGHKSGLFIQDNESALRAFALF